MVAEIIEINRKKAFGGYVVGYKHESVSTKTWMTFNVFLPPKHHSLLTMIYLSGLTCNHENFMQKAGALKAAALKNITIVTPDTSPRGHSPIDGENENWDFGLGAGFYLNATTEKYKENYQMYSYILELRQIIVQNPSIFTCTSNISLCGHSMGGHGALSIYMKNPDLFKCVSAFAPICHPSKCPWGIKAFEGYLNEKKEWEDYDSVVLLKNYAGQHNLKILIEQGSVDDFLVGNQLMPESLLEVSKARNVMVEYRLQEGYDHSYYFISTFIEDHLNWHLSY